MKMQNGKTARRKSRGVAASLPHVLVLQRSGLLSCCLLSSVFCLAVLLSCCLVVLLSSLGRIYAAQDREMHPVCMPRSIAA